VIDMVSVVVMGVSGCGKSSLARALADALDCSLIEGDDFHSPANVAKMQAGVALTDADRHDWLAALAQQLAQHPEGVVMTCSALKKAYRKRLRAAAPGLRFAHLALTREEAIRRVGSRPGHFFNASLVDNQFATLESPAGEPGVIEVDATWAPQQLVENLTAWARQEPSAAG
jgi:gluconokinase